MTYSKYLQEVVNWKEGYKKLNVSERRAEKMVDAVASHLKKDGAKVLRNRTGFRRDGVLIGLIEFNLEGAELLMEFFWNVEKSGGAYYPSSDMLYVTTYKRAGNFKHLAGTDRLGWAQPIEPDIDPKKIAARFFSEWPKHRNYYTS